MSPQVAHEFETWFTVARRVLRVRYEQFAPGCDVWIPCSHAPNFDAAVRCVVARRLRAARIPIATPSSLSRISQANMRRLTKPGQLDSTVQDQRSIATALVALLAKLLAHEWDIVERVVALWPIGGSMSPDDVRSEVSRLQAFSPLSGPDVVVPDPACLERLAMSIDVLHDEDYPFTAFRLQTPVGCLAALAVSQSTRVKSQSVINAHKVRWAVLNLQRITTIDLAVALPPLPSDRAVLRRGS